MPKLDLTIPADALSEEQTSRSWRASSGATLLHWEGAPDTEFFRSITWAHVHALPAGVDPDPRRRRRAARRPRHHRSRAARSATAARPGWSRTPPSSSSRRPGWGTEAGVRVWTLIHEVPDGNWGAAGQVVRFEQLRDAAKAEREQEGSGKEKVPAAAEARTRSRREAAHSSSRRASSSGARRPTRSSRATGEAIVRPVALATCDIDAAFVQGRFPVGNPFSFGHECVGEVTDVGDSVKSVKPGDLVSVPVPDLLRGVRRLSRRRSRQLRVGAAALDLRPARSGRSPTAASRATR